MRGRRFVTVAAAFAVIWSLAAGVAAAIYEAAEEDGTVAAPALPEPFTRVEAFATKTGFRGIVAWSSTTPVLAQVSYGLDPEALSETLPVVDVPDTAGMAVIDDLELNMTYYVSVTDTLTGAVTPPQPLVARNAYNDYGPNTEQDPSEVSFKENVYTIDLLVQLDSQSLPVESSDLTLDEIAAGINVFAERLYDALDGRARLGNVLITDTLVGGAGTTPGLVATHPTGTCDAPRDVADVLVTTVLPFDSHTYLYAIAEPCTPFFLGRLGQLVVPWEDDLHVGYTATHEMMHYAFGAPDLYGAGDITGTASGGCRNLAWDGSLMHNAGGWKGDRWELTEVDRDPTLTPCDQGGEPYTWDQAQLKYADLPDAPLEDVVNTKPRGNPDGGALRIMVLDREVQGSTLTDFTPDDSNPETPVDCGTRDDVLSTSFEDPAGDGNTYALVPTPQNEPALDVLRQEVRFVGNHDGVATAADVLRFELTVDDLQEAPPSAANGEAFDLAFSVGNDTYTVQALWDRQGDPVFEVSHGSGWAADLTGGTWDLDTDTITADVPAIVVDRDGVKHTVLTKGATARGFLTYSRRASGPLGPVADDATGGCGVVVPGVPPLQSGEVDAELVPGGPVFEFEGGPYTETDTYDALGCASPTAPCSTYRIFVSEPGTLTITIAPGEGEFPANDFDLHVTGPDGSDHSVAMEFSDESVTIENAKAGVWEITVVAWVTVNGTFTGSARLT